MGATEPSDTAAFDIDNLYHPATKRSLRALPRLLVGAIRLVWRAAAKELILTVVLQAVGSATLAVQLLAGRQVLSHLVANNSSKDFSSAIPAVILLIAALAVNSVTRIARSETQRLLSELVARYSMQQVIVAATAADLIRFESPAFHNRLQRAIVNASIRPLQMTNGVLTVGGSLLASAGIGAALLTIAPLFFVLALVAVVPATLATLQLGRVLYRFAVEQTPADRERSYIQALLVDKGPAKEVRAYDLGGFLKRRFDDLYSRRITALRALVKTRLVRGAAGGLLTAAISGGAIGLLILFVATGRTSLAGAGAGAAALILLGSQLQALAGGLGSLYESALFIQDFTNFVEVVPTTSQFEGDADAPTSLERLDVHGLSFTYPSRKDPSLVDIELSIRSGEVVALVGANGSGKTTLAKLLAGLYRPQNGSIEWNGVDTRTMRIDQVRSRVAVLFQDFVHYFLSARENISFGRWERTDDLEAVKTAARRAGADRFLEQLPGGYDTFLGPQFFGGSDISGGQWQRVALARAFFRDSELVILDEPTAALDARSEAELFDAVKSLFAGRSVVLISHRFASVRMADHIYVLDAGRVVEHGSHDELMGQGGIYAELFTLQITAFGLDAKS